MITFEVVARKSLREEDVLAAFVQAVAKPTIFPERSRGIEGVAEWGFMRWRERDLDSDGGVTYGPDVEARVASESSILRVRCRIRPRWSYWLLPSVTFAVCLGAFLAAELLKFEWSGPSWMRWILPLIGISTAAQSYLGLRRTAQRAQKFVASLLEEAPIQLPEPTAASGRGSS